MPRLFTGLEIPAEIGHTLSSLRGGLPGARWIDPENYHVTLRFIGDIDDRMAHEIASMLDGMRRRSFEVRFGGLKSFGGRKPRAIVVAVEPIQPLIELQAEQERLMQRLGLEPEGRKFTPHVTLARWKGRAQRLDAWLASHGGIASALWEVREFILYESHLGREGAHYEPIELYTLD